MPSEYVTATMRLERISSDDNTYSLITSPDIPGLYLAYNDVERALHLVIPVARTLLWKNKEQVTIPLFFDPDMLRDRGITLLALQVVEYPIEGVVLSEDDGEIWRNSEELYFFVPKEIINGEQLFHDEVMERIRRDIPS